MFPVGSTVQIIGYLDKRKLNSRIIGWAENEYVVVEHPVVQGELAMLPKDAAVVCRGTIDGRTYAFKSHVQHVMTQPFHYLFLVFPHDIQEIAAKGEPRLIVNLPASVVLCPKDVPQPPPGMQALTGTLQSLGNSGCVVILPQEVDPRTVGCAFLTFEMPNGTSVEGLKATVDPDEVQQPTTSVDLHFDESDPKVSTIFDFLLLASKIISQSENEK